jgi:hypothetical protein
MRDWIVKGDPTVNPFVPYDNPSVYEVAPHYFWDSDIAPNGEQYYEELDGMREEHACYERWSLIAWRKAYPNCGPKSYEDYCKINTYATYTNGGLISKAGYKSLIAWRKTSSDCLGPEWHEDPESYEDFCQLNTYAMYKNGELISKADYNRRYDETPDADIFYTEALGDWHIDGFYNWHYHRFETL